MDNTFNGEPFTLRASRQTSEPKLTVFSFGSTTKYYFDKKEESEIYEKSRLLSEELYAILILLIYIFIAGFILSCVIYYFNKSYWVFGIWIGALFCQNNIL
jgi:hypothetical protein